MFFNPWLVYWMMSNHTTAGRAYTIDECLLLYDRGELAEDLQSNGTLLFYNIKHTSLYCEKYCIMKMLRRFWTTYTRRDGCFIRLRSIKKLFIKTLHILTMYKKHAALELRSIPELMRTCKCILYVVLCVFFVHSLQIICEPLYVCIRCVTLEYILYLYSFGNQNRCQTYANHSPRACSLWLSSWFKMPLCLLSSLSFLILSRWDI